MSEPTPAGEEREPADAAGAEPTASETPADEAETPETPADETPADEAETPETPADETPADETPADETPADEAETPETPAGEPPTAAPAPVLEPEGAKLATPKPAATRATPPSPAAASPPAQLGTRLAGAAWLTLFGVFGFVLVRRVYGHDFGTTNVRVLTLIRLASLALTAYPALLGLYALATGRRPPARLNPLGAPLQGWWYQGLWALTWRELKQVFFHPVAYIVLFVYLAINGILMGQLVEYFASANAGGAGRSFAYFLSNNFLLWVSLTLICPALTMRTIAEERRGRSLELLLTAPVTETQVVLSKFAATLGYFLFMTAFSLVYVLLLVPYVPGGAMDWGPILSGHLGLSLLGAFAIACGVFTSSLTRSQILAYLISASLLFGLLVIVPIVLQNRGLPLAVRGLLSHLAVTEHQDQFASGIVSWRSLSYYATSVTLLLFLAVRGVAGQGGR